MLVAFPSPVLSVAADAVRDLDGGEAIPGLWTLFTKCKASLKDGRRLENISWRLWYREMMMASGPRYEPSFDSNSEKCLIDASDSAYRPPTPDEVTQQVGASESTAVTFLHVSKTTDRSIYAPSATRSTATRRPSSVSVTRKAKPIGYGVGRIICDLLPQSFPPPEELRRAVASRRTPSTAPAAPVQDACPLKCNLPPSDASAKSSLPTPSAEDNELRALPHVSSPDGATPQGQTSPDPLDSRPVQLLQAQDPCGSEVPAVTVVDTSSFLAPLIAASNLIHSSPESSLRDPDPSPGTTLATPHGLTLPPPRLIIVNPTPNPTPHPTPPATPVLHCASPQFILTAGVQVAVPSGNQHLHPPPLFHMVPILPAVPAVPELDHQGASPADIAAASITPVGEAQPPRVEREDVQVPPSPALTEEALAPLHPDAKELDRVDFDQLRHPLTIQTKVETATSKRKLVMLVPSSPSVIAHIFGNPQTTEGAGAADGSVIFSASPAKESLVVDSPTKRSGNDSPRQAHRQSSGTGTGTGKAVGGPRKTIRANSAGHVPTTTSAGQSRSGSRSRTRDNHNNTVGLGLGLGVGALAMTRTASAGGTTRSKSKVAGGGSRALGARFGNRKSVDKERERSKEKDNVKEKEDDNSLKRPTFNIGSNSDEGSGMGSKSIGSGSEVSGAPQHPPVGATNEEVVKQETKIVVEKIVVQKIVVQKNEKEVENQKKAQLVQEEKMIIGAQAALEALLPQQQRRIVLATSESDEYETETDDGSWSSEEISAEETEVVKSGGSHAPRPKQSQLERASTHPPPVDDTRHPPPHPPHHHTQAQPGHQNDKRNQAARNTRRQLLNQAKAHAQSIEQAALEAQRQREMFAKIPPSQNLARTTSVGLLSQLMNPDPQIFPPNHPYRRGFSSGEIRSHQGQGKTGLSAGLTMTGVATALLPNAHQVQVQARHAQQPPPEQRPIAQQLPAQRLVPQEQVPMQRPVHEQGQGTLAPPVATPAEVRRHVSAPQQQQHHQPVGTMPVTGLILAPSLKPSKSAAAAPLASQLQVGSLRPSNRENGVLGSQALANKLRMNGIVKPAGGYRPRARPQDAELEDDSGSEEESGIQLSKSVAQEKLRALAERRGIRPNRRTSTDDAYDGGLPAWAEQPEHQEQHHHPVEQQHRPRPRPRHMQPPPGPVRMHTSPAPIPQGLAHPYNLPLTALPTTPRTTRLHMLQTEMSESLRRNLLWERQVSKNNILGFRRTASSGGAARGNPVNGLRPLTTNEPPNIVHLSAKGTNNNVNGNQKQNNAAAGGAAQAAVGQESSRKAFGRNRSWAADDYHYAGW